jgi:hypothetical protein
MTTGNRAVGNASITTAPECAARIAARSSPHLLSSPNVGRESTFPWLPDRKIVRGPKQRNNDLAARVKRNRFP